MRVPGTVLRRLSAGIFILVLILAAAVPVFADTGTYKISDYSVTLEPQNDGRVRITIDQQWIVLGGHIPWVTAGLPNDNFTVEGYEGDVSRVSAANSGGFSGVRIDLNKDYQKDQTFGVRFSVLQNKLLERLPDEGKWRIDYTPGWYDRAVTDRSQINLVSPVDYQSYSSVSPMPASVKDNVITWERTGLASGGRYNIRVESTDGSFLTAAPPSTSSSGGIFSPTFFIIIGVILVVGLVIFWGIRANRQARDVEMKKRVANIEEQMAADRRKKEEVEKGFEEYIEKKDIQPDEQGRYYDRSYGNYITPAIWAAVISSQYFHQGERQNTPSTRSSCACVSCACACACACAGGGAAGCSRKSLHECRTCEGKIPASIQTGKKES